MVRSLEVELFSLSPGSARGVTGSAGDVPLPATCAASLAVAAALVAVPASVAGLAAPRIKERLRRRLADPSAGDGGGGVAAALKTLCGKVRDGVPIGAAAGCSCSCSCSWGWHLRAASLMVVKLAWMSAVDMVLSPVMGRGVVTEVGPRFTSGVVPSSPASELALTLGLPRPMLPRAKPRRPKESERTNVPEDVGCMSAAVGLLEALALQMEPRRASVPVVWLVRAERATLARCSAAAPPRRRVVLLPLSCSAL